MKRVLSWLAMLSLAVFLVAPFIWMVLVSLHPAKSPIPDYKDLIPPHPQWSNYHLVLFSPEVPVGRFFLNSAIVAIAVVVGQLFITSLAAYALARIKFKGAKFLFWMFLASMMFAGVVTQIPVYLFMRGAGLLDSLSALIIPGLSSAYSVFLLRQFLMGLPYELDEAAFLDGASYWTVYAKVLMPLSKPALATVASFTFFSVWTDFFWPLLATNSMRLRTLEVGLSIFKNSYGTTNWPLQMAAAVITLVPMIVVFLLSQRYFTKGIQMSGMK
jgi:multiple sugar transport system permease protein